MMCRITPTALALALFLSTHLHGEEKPVVHTVNYPLHYFADRIAGDLIDLQFLAPAEGDPAFWKPSDKEVAAMQQADLLLLNGADYAKWTSNVTLPRSILIDTAEGFEDDFIIIKDAVKHSHGDGHVHSHDGIAFTTWLDMTQARKHAEAIHEALVSELPEAKEKLDENAAALFADLAELDTALKKEGERLDGTALLGSHPVYHYLSRRYGFAIESLHWEPDVVPDEEALAELDKKNEDHGARWMLWEGEPASDSVELLEERDISSVVFDPTGNRPGEGDWLSVMRANVKALQSITGG